MPTTEFILLQEAGEGGRRSRSNNRRMAFLIGDRAALSGRNNNLDVEGELARLGRKSRIDRTRGALRGI